MNTKLSVRLAAVALTALASLVQASLAQAADAPKPLDRAALIKLANDYFGALLAHDPGKAPLASDVKTVENAKRIKAGEGLWKTTTAGPTEFRIVVPDAVSQEVGGMFMIESENKPAQVGFRLKVVNGKITEAEHMIAMPREQMLANLKTLRPAIPIEVPYEYRDSRGRLLHMAKSYYDALDLNNGSLAPFAPDCERHENGMRTAPSGGPSLAGAGIPGQPVRPPSLMGMNDCKSQLDSQTMSYISVIDDRRVEIADEQTGLALGFSHFRHEMKQKEYKLLNDPSRDVSTMNFAPFDLPAMHIFKIWGGQIHEIEAMGFMAPYNSPTGWE
ncbi:MAG: hypothetical protein WDO68_19210 [Gammaproteobacteria bacterium]